MKSVIVLRHAEKTGDAITQAGAEACKALAPDFGELSVVLCSETNRAAQTAQLISGRNPCRDARANIPQFPESARAQLQAAQGTHPLGIVGAIWQEPELVEFARAAGRRLLELVQETLDELPESGRALIVSHDGTMVALAKLLRDESFESANYSFGPLEGLVIDEMLRVRNF